MSKKNETTVLIVTLLITMGLIGTGIWIVKSKFLTKTPNSPTTVTSLASSSQFSTGERVLITNEVNNNPSFITLKEGGVLAINAGKYEEAISYFESALKLSSNAPETQIYLNNAKIGNNKSYTIAIITPAGVDRDGALELLRGVAQAQIEINQKNGINGIPLKVMIVSDNNDEKIAQQVAQKLIDTPDVLGVIGHWASQVSLATAPLYAQGKLVVISPISTSVKLTGINPYFFRTVPSDYIAGRSLANYMLKEFNVNKVVVYFNSQSAYSLSLKSEFSTAVSLEGGQVVNEVDLSDPNFNANQSIEQAKQQGAEAIMLAANTATLNQALAVVKINQNHLKLLAGDDVYTFTTLQQGGKEAQGMIIAIPWHIKAHPNEPFVVTSERLWGGADVNWRTALAYDSTKVLIQALSVNPTREGIQQALTNPNFTVQGATERIRFLPSHDVNRSIQLVQIIPDTQFPSGVKFSPVK